MECFYQRILNSKFSFFFSIFKDPIENFLKYKTLIFNESFLESFRFNNSTLFIPRSPPPPLFCFCFMLVWSNVWREKRGAVHSKNAKFSFKSFIPCIPLSSLSFPPFFNPLFPILLGTNFRRDQHLWNTCFHGIYMLRQANVCECLEFYINSIPIVYNSILRELYLWLYEIFITVSLKETFTKNNFFGLRIL